MNKGLIFGVTGFALCTVSTLGLAFNSGGLADKADRDKVSALKEFRSTENFTEIYNLDTANFQTKLEEAKIEFEEAKAKRKTGEISISEYEVAKTSYEQSNETYEKEVKYYNSDEYALLIMDDFASDDLECVLKYQDACKLRNTSNNLFYGALGCFVGVLITGGITIIADSFEND